MGFATTFAFLVALYAIRTASTLVGESDKNTLRFLFLN